MCVNKTNKTGDSYLACIAMAHSPQVLARNWHSEFVSEETEEIRQY
jgi:hypothetical protein